MCDELTSRLEFISVASASKLLPDIARGKPVLLAAWPPPSGCNQYSNGDIGGRQEAFSV